MNDNSNEQIPENEDLYPQTEELKQEVEKQKEDLDTQNALLEQTEDNGWAEEIFQKDLDNIKKEFPFVQATHISQLGEDFLSLMAAGQQVGISPADAYAATHRNEIFAQAQKKAKSDALTSLASKSHMKPVLGTGGITQEIPQSVYNKYKRLMPNISDSEIRKHYLSSKED